MLTDPSSSKNEARRFSGMVVPAGMGIFMPLRGTAPASRGKARSKAAPEREAE